MKQLYILDYENSVWCGGQLHCVAWAYNEDDAEGKASEHMEQEQRELFSEEYDMGDDSEPAYVVNTIQLLEGSEFEEYYADPVQRLNFYPCVNPADAV